MYGGFGDVLQIRCTVVKKWEVKAARLAISNGIGSLKGLSAGKSPSGGHLKFLLLDFGMPRLRSPDILARHQKSVMWSVEIFR